MSQQHGKGILQFSFWFRFNEVMDGWCVRGSVADDHRCTTTEVQEGLCESCPQDTSTTRHGPQLSSLSMAECGEMYIVTRVLVRMRARLESKRKYYFLESLQGGSV